MSISLAAKANASMDLGFVEIQLYISSATFHLYTFPQSILFFVRLTDKSENSYQDCNRQQTGNNVIGLQIRFFCHLKCPSVSNINGQPYPTPYTLGSAWHSSFWVRIINLECLTYLCPNIWRKASHTRESQEDVFGNQLPLWL